MQFELASLLCLSLMATPADKFVIPGYASFDPHQTFRSVGVFGSFGKGGEVQERDHVGLLTFTLRKGAPESTLVYPNYYGTKDLELGRAVFPGGVAQKHFDVLDWTTAKLGFSATDGAKTEVYFSRAFPAVLYHSEAKSWSWKSADVPFDRAAYRTSSGQIAVAKNGQPVGWLGAPWVLLWNSKPLGGEVVPVLVRFEHRPSGLRLDESLSAEFDRSIGSVVVMPLMGIRRSQTPWGDSAPAEALREAEFWSRASGSFPIGTDESYRVDEAAHRVVITDRFKYLKLHDDWSSKSLTIAPVPPVTAMAQAHGYTISWLGGKPVPSPLGTFLGPYVYVPGSVVQYSIPIPSARDNMLSPVRVVGDPSRTSALAELNRLARSQQIKPDDTSDGGLNLQLKEFSQSYRLLDKPVQAELAPKLAAAFAASYSPENLQTITDPVFGGQYVMCGKIWCAGEPYDREWYAGRQLDFTCEYASWVDASALKQYWPAIQGLYAYSRIYNDWAWSGTLSSVFAYALCGDGMNFAMEGMLGIARLARRLGEDEVWRDATYRASKEAVNTFGAFFMSDWVADVNYATWTDTSYDYEAKKGRYVIKRMAPADVQAGFGIDIFSDTTGIKTFRPGSFWHATAGFYWNNPSLYRLYAETLYPQVYKWEFETMPRLFPGWQDRDVPNVFENQKYGSNQALTHVDARAALFGQNPVELESLMTKLQPDIAFLYRLRVQQDLVEAGIPQLWLPTAQVALDDAVWDSSKKTLSLSFRSLSKGAAAVDWTWRGSPSVSSTANPGPKPAGVLVDGKASAFKLIPGGFYRVQLELKSDEACRIVVQY